jgi:hypothetical protein
MTIVKKHIIRKVKDIALGSTLVLALAGGLGSCGNQTGAEGSYDTEEVLTQGVKTYIKEIRKGEFKITDEKQVPVDSSAAIVTYLDGTQETISPKAAQAMIDRDMNNNNYYSHHHSGLSSMLLYGGMGYMFGRSNGGNNRYESQRQAYYQGNPSAASNVYTSPKTYQSAQAVHTNIGSSATRVSRPSGSRSGFFGSSSRTSGIG